MEELFVLALRQTIRDEIQKQGGNICGLANLMYGFVLFVKGEFVVVEIDTSE